MNHEDLRAVASDAKGVTDETESTSLAEIIDDLFRQPQKFGAPDLRKKTDHANRRSHAESD